MYQNAPSRPLSYAPLQTHGSSLSSFHIHASIPLDEELKPFSSPSERDLIDSLSELYSIIRTLDGLERAYQKDALAEPEYNEKCSQMLKQYRSLLSNEKVSEQFGNLDIFMQEWEIEAPRAAETLRTGLISSQVYASNQPTTTGGNLPPTNNSSTSGPPPVSGTLILQATENFITFLDALRLNMLSKSSLHPLLSDVIQSVNKVTDQDFEGRGKIIQWLITLNQLKAHEELSEEMARECAFDIEGAYGGFKGVISSQ